MSSPRRSLSSLLGYPPQFIAALMLAFALGHLLGTYGHRTAYGLATNIAVIVLAAGFLAISAHNDRRSTK